MLVNETKLFLCPSDIRDSLVVILKWYFFSVVVPEECHSFFLKFPSHCEKPIIAVLCQLNVPKKVKLICTQPVLVLPWFNDECNLHLESYLCVLHSFSSLMSERPQTHALVADWLDSATHWMNHYPWITQLIEINCTISATLTQWFFLWIVLSLSLNSSFMH